VFQIWLAIGKNTYSHFRVAIYPVDWVKLLSRLSSAAASIRRCAPQMSTYHCLVHSMLKAAHPTLRDRRHEQARSRQAHSHRGRPPDRLDRDHLSNLRQLVGHMGAHRERRPGCLANGLTCRWRPIRTAPRLPAGASSPLRSLRASRSNLRCRSRPPRDRPMFCSKRPLMTCRHQPSWGNHLNAVTQTRTPSPARFSIAVTGPSSLQTEFFLVFASPPQLCA
jgi:hypothetical protein